MSTAEAAIQTHCDKIDSLAAATNEMVAAMNHRMERDAETIRVLREACEDPEGVEEFIVKTLHDAGHGELAEQLDARRKARAAAINAGPSIQPETREAGPDLQSTIDAMLKRAGEACEEAYDVEATQGWHYVVSLYDDLKRIARK